MHGALCIVRNDATKRQVLQNVRSKDGRRKEEVSRMGKKYIIVLNPDCVEGEYLRIPARIAGEQQWLMTKAALTPYTEPDLEQIRKEAYEKGYEDGFVAGYLKAEKSGQSFYEDGYKRGLSEAWEACRIKVGDEVERILDGEVDSKAVFLEENNGYYHCLFWTGSFFTTLSYPKKLFRKTGRHFPEIAAVLEKMRGEQK